LIIIRCNPKIRWASTSTTFSTITAQSQCID
jgi:hypothetical protein